jgi:hypothetical protein
VSDEFEERVIEAIADAMKAAREEIALRSDIDMWKGEAIVFYRAYGAMEELASWKFIQEMGEVQKLRLREPSEIGIADETSQKHQEAPKPSDPNEGS